MLSNSLKRCRGLVSSPDVVCQHLDTDSCVTQSGALSMSFIDTCLSQRRLTLTQLDDLAGIACKFLRADCASANLPQVRFQVDGRDRTDITLVHRPATCASFFVLHVYRLRTFLQG